MRLSKTNRYDFGVVSAATHKSMQGNKRRDTKPEVLVRRMLRRWAFPATAAVGGKRPGVRTWRSWGASSPSRSAAASGIGVRVQPVGAQERTSITGRLSSPATSSATEQNQAARGGRLEGARTVGTPTEEEKSCPPRAAFSTNSCAARTTPTTMRLFRFARGSEHSTNSLMFQVQKSVNMRLIQVQKNARTGSE